MKTQEHLVWYCGLFDEIFDINSSMLRIPLFSQYARRVTKECSARTIPERRLDVWALGPKYRVFALLNFDTVGGTCCLPVQSSRDGQR